jgi:hypothetical protein
MNTVATEQSVMHEHVARAKYTLECKSAYFKDRAQKLTPAVTNSHNVCYGSLALCTCRKRQQLQDHCCASSSVSIKHSQCRYRIIASLTHVALDVANAAIGLPTDFVFNRGLELQALHSVFELCSA